MQCTPHRKRTAETSGKCRECAAELIEVATLMRYERQHDRYLSLIFDSRTPPKWVVDVADGRRPAGYNNLDRQMLKHALRSRYPIVYTKGKLYRGVLLEHFAGPGYYMLGAPETCGPLGILDQGGLIPRPSKG